MFPLGLSYLSLTYKRNSWKALGLADRCGLVCSSLCAKRTICFDVTEPCIFPTGPECTVQYSSVECRAKAKEIHPRIGRECPDNVLIFSIFCALIRFKTVQITHKMHCNILRYTYSQHSRQ